MAEETEELTIEEETPEVPVEETPVKKTKIKTVITQKEILSALEENGGTARSGQLREKIIGNYPNVKSPELGTAIRKKALEMAEAGKIEAVHVDEKRTWTFKAKA